jgi:hypothetical protein
MWRGWLGKICPDTRNGSLDDNGNIAWPYHLCMTVTREEAHDR